MPRTCSICGHKDRLKIDAEIVAGGSLRHIASQFGVCYRSLGRHKEHVGQAIVKAAEQRQVDLGGSLIDQMHNAVVGLRKYVGEMEMAEDWRGCVVGVRAETEVIMQLIELMEKDRGSRDSDTILARMQRAEARERDAEAESSEQRRVN